LLNVEKGENLSKIVNKNILFSYVLRGIGVLSLYLLVPLLIDSLGRYSYGIWITLSSFIGWFNFFDVGLGHGLRNKLVEAFAEKNYKSAREYIKAAYIILGTISIFLILIISVTVFNVNWAHILNLETDLNSTLKTSLFYLLIGIAVQLFLKNIKYILLADQQTALSMSISTFQKGFIFALVWLVIVFENLDLINLSIIYAFVPIAVLTIYSIYLFTFKYKSIKPSLLNTAFNFEIGKDITGLGFKFFVLQVGAVLLYSTDQVIITMFLGPEYVTDYDIAYKYFQLILLAFSIYLAPYWSAFGDAFQRKDKVWIKKHIKKLVSLWALGTLMLFVMVMLADDAYSLWIGEDISINMIISISMAIYVSTYMFQSIFINFINGIGKLRIQMIHIGVSAVLNIPLSIFLATTFGLGVSGVIIATIITQLIGAIIYPIQYKYILNETGPNVWRV
jgi:O-antigen/teichoic acid export membrane protein